MNMVVFAIVFLIMEVEVVAVLVLGNGGREEGVVELRGDNLEVVEMKEEKKVQVVEMVEVRVVQE